MKTRTEQLLREAQQYCDDNDKSTEFMLEYMQDISDDDAIAEGIVIEETPFTEPMNAYASLWDKINGKKYPWSSNPWVWVISFERINNA
jgi:hypothetical protein